MGKWVWLIVMLVCRVTLATAQDIDSNPVIQKRSVSSIADQITDPSERRAFLQLFPQGPPEQMRARAEAFLSRFPQSAFLAQAYEVAARASFDLQDYEPGLDFARRSLSLLPENPLLLVSMADVEAHRHRNEAAIADAEKALHNLDRFAGPSTVREEDWPKVKRWLEASANFSKGRALLQQGLELPAGNKRAQLLKNSTASLIEARRLNSGDTEITYTLGLVELTAGEPWAAAGDFAAVYRGDGKVAPQALDNLQAIYKLMYPGSDLPFETFVQRAQDRRIKVLQDSEGLNERRPVVQPAYIGSESCRGCHSEIYKQWSDSGMAKMFRPYAPENVVGDFKIDNQFYLGDDVEYRGNTVVVTRGRRRSLFARMAIRNRRHYFDILQSNGKWHTYPDRLHHRLEVSAGLCHATTEWRDSRLSHPIQPAAKAVDQFLEGD